MQRKCFCLFVLFFRIEGSRNKPSEKRGTYYYEILKYIPFTKWQKILSSKRSARPWQGKLQNFMERH